MSALAAVVPLVATPPDLTPVTDQMTALAPVIVTALGIALAAGLTVMAIKWGAPQIVGFFKKTAK